MASSFLVLGFVLVLAYCNGANDVSRGIATLVGGGVAHLRTAILWGSLWTVAGGTAAAYWATGLVQAFSGKGLIQTLPDGPAFALAISSGAILWISLATRLGMPVSTTHSLTGALAGAGCIASGFGGLHWPALAGNFLLPLALTPLIALALVFLLFPALNFLAQQLQGYCVCISRAVLPNTAAETLAVRSAENLVVGNAADCDCAPATVMQLNGLDALHWLSAAATSFARGLNDTPKIFALGAAVILSFGIEPSTGFFLVAAGMGLGSVAAGFRVTETLARKVTPMSPKDGFVANLITSTLVIIASKYALPVSTTHVSGGAIIGLGLKQRPGETQWKTVRDMLLAWLVTMPAAALVAAAVFWLLQ